MDISRIASRTEKYSIISFDIFDTLLKRDVLKPTDVFSLVEKMYQKRYNKTIEFKEKRIAAEKTARTKSQFSDITLDEIYAEYEVPEKETLKRIELEIESSVLHFNKEIKQVYDKCLEEGKQIYIISDMYLPADFLETILQREGYSGYKKLYLSCDYRKTKRSGELYKEFSSLERINPKEVLHIGDSKYADYIGARKAGIKPIYIKRTENHTLYSDIPNEAANINESSLFAFVNNRISKQESRAEKLGYEVLGPIIYSYCAWIYEQYTINRTLDSRLWFAARDMYLFAEAYKKMYNTESEMEYVYISRNSLRPVLTQSTGKMEESGNVFARGENTLEEILHKMGYSKEDVEEPEKYDFSKKYDVRKLDEYSEVVSALSSPRIIQKEEELSSAGIQYLKEHGLFDGNIYLADVGWHGTTQYILDRIQQSIAGNGTIKGLYIGCLDGTNEKIGKDNYQAFSFTEEKESSFGKGIILFESLILAPHGSTKRYQIENGISRPILGEPDNLVPFLAGVQEGALRFVDDFSNSILSETINIPNNIATKAFCRLALVPQKEELDSIGNLDYENFGTGKMAAPKGILFYVMHPKSFAKDLKYSPWRIGFLYKLFKVRLPYAKIYSFARRKQGRMT